MTYNKVEAHQERPVDVCHCGRRKFADQVCCSACHNVSIQAREATLRAAPHVVQQYGDGVDEFDQRVHQPPYGSHQRQRIEQPIFESPQAVRANRK